LRLLPWGVAPFLIAPRAGKLADRIGERPLVVSGTLLQAAGFAPAIAAATGLALAGALAGLALPGRPGQAQYAPTERAATARQARTAEAAAAGQ
jgi:hypothetical protein